MLSYYGYRISKIQAQSEQLENQRTTTIEKLKTATKYNSTQELLNKYGSTPSPKGKSPGPPKQADTSTPRNSGRINVVPPPTANIPKRLGQTSLPTTPPRSTAVIDSPSSQIAPYSAAAATATWEQPFSRQDTSAEFAPNAFPTTSQYAQPSHGPRWYDRLVDALLGEDETLPKNRIALICEQCRLVNGQAPPGVKTLEDIGRWRCGGCNTMNGKESTRKLVASIEKELASEKEEASAKKKVSFTAKKPTDDENGPSQLNGDHESDVTQYSDEPEADREISENIQSVSEPAAETDTPRRRSTRAKSGGKKG